MTETAVKLEALQYRYPNAQKGLESICLEIPAMKKTVILGLNGAGKSTLFLSLCGVLKPQSGKYWLEGKLFSFSRKEQIEIGRTIGYVFQDPEVQLFAPTVYEDVAFGLHNSGYEEEQVRKQTEKYLDFLNISHLKDAAPHELSYGQKKLVAIAGVLVMQPKILMLDEPFAWLDNVQEKNMKAILAQLHQQGMTIILSTHDLDFAFSWADYGIVLKEGHCKLQGNIAELRAHRATIWE